MSIYKTKDLVENFDGFGGLDLSAPMGGGRFSVFKNFKLLPDGSAIKRNGFRYIASTEGEVRGEQAYSDGGESVILSVIGSSLYRISVADGETTHAEVFATSEGRVKFFGVMGELYIYDGDSLYRYTGQCFAEKCEVYSPLYGKDWSTGHVAGSMNEPFNMLSPRIRISYKCNGEMVGTLSVGKKIKSVDAMFRDGEKVLPNLYSIASNQTQITCKDVYVLSELVVYLTLDLSEYKNSDFDGCDRVDVFDAFTDSRVFMYGGENEERFYVSAPVSEDDVKHATSVYGYVAPIYFPKGEGHSFVGSEKITAMARVCDRMMIFSEHRAWVTSSLTESEGRERMGVIADPISDNAGCSSYGAVVLTDGVVPLSVSLGGIYKWVIDPGFEQKITLSKISGNLGSLADSVFWRNAAVGFHRGENEIWFANTASENGEVLVFNCESKAWYYYDGIAADKLFEVGETLAFRKGDAVYVFSSDEGYDCYEWGERGIDAVIESAVFDFSAPDRKKHISGAHISCELDGGVMTLELAEGHSLANVTLDESKVSAYHNGIHFFDLRMRTGRCKRVCFRLTASGKCRQRVFGAAFFAS